MLSLILAAGLALAEPDPSIQPPTPTVHPAEVSGGVVEVTEPGEADVVADGELVEPVVLEKKAPTPFQRFITNIVGIFGMFIAAPYEDEALVLVLGGVFAELRLWLDRRRRKRRELDSMLSSSKPNTLGAVAERKMRELADERVKERIDELTNLQRTEITVLQSALAKYIAAEQEAEGIPLWAALSNERTGR